MSVARGNGREKAGDKGRQRALQHVLNAVSLIKHPCHRGQLAAHVVAAAPVTETTLLLPLFPPLVSPNKHSVCIPPFALYAIRL